MSLQLWAGWYYIVDIYKTTFESHNKSVHNNYKEGIYCIFIYADHDTQDIKAEFQQEYQWKKFSHKGAWTTRTPM